MKKMSIKQLASDMNVSTATISYVLNGKAKEKRISDQLAKKIKKYAKEKNYNPNLLASGLRSGKTKIICLMVEDIADIFFASVAGYIEQIAYDKGYKIIYCSTKNNTLKAQELINTFRNRNVDGFIITPPIGLEEDMRSLIEEKLPLVIFDRFIEGLDISYVGMDNFESSYKATKHLLDEGFKKIALVTLDSVQSQMVERLGGYEKAMNEVGLPTIIEKIDYELRHERAVIDKIEDLIIKNSGVDALYFATNYLATRGLEAINKMGLELVKDLGMLVFDDSDLFRVHRPTISAISQPISEMSVKLISILLKHLNEEKEYKPETKIIPAKLMIRESSKRKISE